MFAMTYDAPSSIAAISCCEGCTPVDFSVRSMGDVKKFYASQCFGPTDQKVQSMVIMRLSAVSEATGIPRSTLYLYIKKNEFPKPVKLGVRSVGWIRAEVDEWLAKRMEQRQ